MQLDFNMELYVHNIDLTLHMSWVESVDGLPASTINRLT